MDKDYFHLIDTEEKVKWTLQNYGIESLKLVLSNLIEEVADLSSNLNKGSQAIRLIQNIIDKENSYIMKEIKIGD